MTSHTGKGGRLSEMYEMNAYWLIEEKSADKLKQQIPET